MRLINLIMLISRHILYSEFDRRYTPHFPVASIKHVSINVLLCQENHISGKPSLGLPLEIVCRRCLIAVIIAFRFLESGKIDIGN